MKSVTFTVPSPVSYSVSSTSESPDVAATDGGDVALRRDAPAAVLGARRAVRRTRHPSRSGARTTSRSSRCGRPRHRLGVADDRVVLDERRHGRSSVGWSSLNLKVTVKASPGSTRGAMRSTSALVGAAIGSRETPASAVRARQTHVLMPTERDGHCPTPRTRVARPSSPANRRSPGSRPPPPQPAHASARGARWAFPALSLWATSTFMPSGMVGLLSRLRGGVACGTTIAPAGVSGGIGWRGS